MIIVKLAGGLGNQMFQYAMGRALSRRTGTQVYYDKSWFSQVPTGRMPKRMPFELDIFSMPLVFVQGRQIPWEARPLPGDFDYLRRRLLRCVLGLKTSLGMSPSIIFANGILELCPEVFKIVPGQSVYLEGDWQSEQYFKDAEPVLREDFIFRTAPDPQNSAILAQMAADRAAGVSSVSVHIRRGDWALEPRLNAIHGVLPLDYYRAAMSLIEQRWGRVSYYIFSNDLSWCRENLKFNAPVTFVDFNVGKTNYMDMRLMSACQHHIIANSSFSWWGAWLNPCQDKVVIAPQKWFSSTRLKGEDIVPQNWLKI